VARVAQGARAGDYGEDALREERWFRRTVSFFVAHFLRFIAKFIRKNRKFPGNFCKDGCFQILHNIHNKENFRPDVFPITGFIIVIPEYLSGGKLK
jgi:hypothetical protein